jgi:ABC-type Fe3+ transport system permease subunit
VTVTRADIEAKARQLSEAVSETQEAARNTAVLAGVAVLVAIGVAYLVGRRKARSGRAVVEVYRI